MNVKIKEETPAMAANNDPGVCDVLEEIFDKATKYVQTIASKLDSTKLLHLYALYKQATVGPCNIPRPHWYQIQAKQKWDAWNALGDIYRADAMENYVQTVFSINPAWESEVTTEHPSQSWIAVSRLSNTDKELLDTDKTFLDWLKEGNNEKVKEMLLKDETLINLQDENGLLPIHWAADRGYLNIVESLVQAGANINCRDQDGQTALHYAASCGHIDVLKYLLTLGAQSLEDNDGMKPRDVADDKVVTFLP